MDIKRYLFFLCMASLYLCFFGLEPTPLEFHVYPVHVIREKLERFSCFVTSKASAWRDLHRNSRQRRNFFHCLSSPTTPTCTIYRTSTEPSFLLPLPFTTFTFPIVANFNTYEGLWNTHDPDVNRFRWVKKNHVSINSTSTTTITTTTKSSFPFSKEIVTIDNKIAATTSSTFSTSVITIGCNVTFTSRLAPLQLSTRCQVRAEIPVSTTSSRLNHRYHVWNNQDS